MAEIPDVIAGDPIEAAWGNQIRDRSLQRYATAAARDAANPAPVTGDMAWITTEAEEGLTVPGISEIHDGTAWRSFARQDGAVFETAAGVGGVSVFNTGFAFADGSVNWDVSGSQNMRFRGSLGRPGGTDTLFQLGGSADSFQRVAAGARWHIRPESSSVRVFSVAEDSVLGDGTGQAQVLVNANGAAGTVDDDGTVSVRNIHFSDVAPLAGDGEDGDVWFRHQ